MVMKTGLIISDKFLLTLKVNMIDNNTNINSIALRTAKTLWSFGRSECNRVEGHGYNFRGSYSTIFCCETLLIRGHLIKEIFVLVGANSLFFKSRPHCHPRNKTVTL